MKAKTATRILAGVGLAGIYAVHWMPRRLLPFASRSITSAVIVGVLIAVHRGPLKVLLRDAERSLRRLAEGNSEPAGTSQGRPRIV